MDAHLHWLIASLKERVYPKHNSNSTAQPKQPLPLRTCWKLQIRVQAQNQASNKTSATQQQVKLLEKRKDHATKIQKQRKHH